MKQDFNNLLMIIGAILLLSGCAGYNRILFLTKTNVGIDVSREPLPTAEITIARREVALLPTYQDTIANQDKTLPLFGAFSQSGGLLNPNIVSVFAGGSAAVAIASGGKSSCDVPKKDKNDKNASDTAAVATASSDASDTCDSITLNEYPDDRGWFERFWKSKPKPEETNGQVKPFYFATDTSYGAKVAWDGTGGPYPTSLKIGYNRTEFAYPPILISGKENQYIVKVPTFYASIENKSRFNVTQPDAGVSQTQVFATGKAAKAWAEREEVLKAVKNLVFPPASPAPPAPTKK